jgi:hypothetical protein
MWREKESQVVVPSLDDEYDECDEKKMKLVTDSQRASFKSRHASPSGSDDDWNEKTPISNEYNEDSS